MVPSTNRPGHCPFKAAMQGSNPAGITIFRIGVMEAHLTLTQEIVVQIHDPEPQYSPVVQMANTPDCLSGDRGFESRRGCHLASSSNWPGRQTLNLVMLSSSLTEVTKNHRDAQPVIGFPWHQLRRSPISLRGGMEYTAGLSPDAARMRVQLPPQVPIEMRECWNWQTGQAQTLVLERACGIVARLSHHIPNYGSIVKWKGTWLQPRRRLFDSVWNLHAEQCRTAPAPVSKAVGSRNAVGIDTSVPRHFCSLGRTAMRPLGKRKPGRKVREGSTPSDCAIRAG